MCKFEHDTVCLLEEDFANAMSKTKAILGGIYSIESAKKMVVRQDEFTKVSLGLSHW